MTHQEASNLTTPPREPYSRSARRFALSTELRGLRAQAALLKRATHRLQKIEGAALALQSKKPNAKTLCSSLQRLGTALGQLTLILLNGKTSVMAPIQKLVTEAQEVVDITSSRHPLFSALTVIPPKEESLEKLTTLLSKVGSAYHLAETARSTAVARLADLKKGQRRIKRATDTEQETVTEVDKSKKKIKDFLEGMKTRGWKITESKKPEPVPLTPPAYNPVAVLNSVRCPDVCLLDPSTEVGLVKVPLLVAIANSLTVNSLINAIKESNLDYVVQHCYSKYYVIDGALSMGIHRSMMKVFEDRPSKLRATLKPTSSDAVLSFGEFLKSVNSKSLAKAVSHKKKKKIDTAKFRAFLPFLEKEEVLYADQLPKLSIVDTPLRVSDHYYCPLLPKALAKDLDFSLESWSFLVKK